MSEVNAIRQYRIGDQVRLISARLTYHRGFLRQVGTVENIDGTKNTAIVKFGRASIVDVFPSQIEMVAPYVMPALRVMRRIVFRADQPVIDPQTLPRGASSLTLDQLIILMCDYIDKDDADFSPLGEMGLPYELLDIAENTRKLWQKENER